MTAARPKLSELQTPARSGCSLPRGDERHNARGDALRLPGLPASYRPQEARRDAGLAKQPSQRRRWARPQRRVRKKRTLLSIQLDPLVVGSTRTNNGHETGLQKADVDATALEVQLSTSSIRHGTRASRGRKGGHRANESHQARLDDPIRLKTRP